jgi:hypothetical protein
MLGATRRLEAKQAKRYGGEAAFQRYLRTTGALAPRVQALRLPRIRAGAAPDA